MNLREQFEKETGEPWSYDGYLATKSYIEWLEQRNKEQVEVLKFTKEVMLLAEIWDNDILSKERLKDFNEASDKIEEQLKKSGGL